MRLQLLDLNTRPWKWIGLPIAAGVDLPWLLCAAATGVATDPVERRDDVIWVSFTDFLPLRARGEAMQAADLIGRERRLRLIRGQVSDGIATAIFDPTDPEPFHRVLEAAFGHHRYSCPC